MTVLVGPNGSGKSTVFDVFAFLSECFEFGLRRAWDRRGRARQLRTRGSDQPLTIELQYRERPKSQGGRRKSPRITYHLSIDERKGVPVIVHEWLQWRRRSHGRPYRFLEYREGEGAATTGETPDSEDQRVESSLNSSDLLAVNALGQFEHHPRVAALRNFIMGWHVSHFSTSNAHHQPEAGPHERLTGEGRSSRSSGLLARTRAEEVLWRVVNRVVVQELEAWYFGDWEAVRSMYPKVNANIPRKTGFRDPDATPDTWEAFERILRRAGYFKTGLRKIEAARDIAPRIELEQNRSGSFQQFRRAIMEALSSERP